MRITEKAEWIAEYYGVRIIVGALAVLTAAVAVKSIFFSVPENDISVLMLSDQVTQSMADSYEEELAEITGKKVEIVAYRENDAYGKQAFAAKVGTDLTDLVIAPEHETELLQESSFLMSSAVLDGTGLCMGIPRGARDGSELQNTMEYLEEQIINIS